MAAIVQEIITLLYSGMTQMATSIGTALGTLVTNIFLSGAGTTEDPYKLSVFGGVVIAFAAISLAFSLARWVLHFVTTMGATRNA